MSPNTVADVAVVGTGRMGGAMVGTLRRADLRVIVHNRTRDKAEKVADATGATVAGSARDAAAGASTVIVSLADDTAVRAAYDGDDGIAAGLNPGAVVLDTSTIAPETLREVAPLVEARGAALLDCPVSGSVSVVESGQLGIMVGGDGDALERVRPILEVLGAKIFHVGGQGAGMIMKLAVNDVIHALNQAVSEALVLAERAGVAREAAYEVFAGSAAAAPFVHYKQESYLHPDETPVAFSLDLVAKDLDLILALGQRAGARMDQAQANRRTVGDAVEAGYGDRDLSALASFLRS